MVYAEFHSDACDHDPRASHRRVAQGKRIEGKEIAGAGNRRSRTTAARAGLSMGGDLPDRQKGLDLVIHAV